MSRNLMRKKRSFEAIYLLNGLVVLIIAALFTLSFTEAAFTQGTMLGNEQGYLKGEVIAVNAGHQWRTLTLRSDEIGQYPNDTLNVFLSQNANVKICGMSEPANDIAVGRNVTITYHEVGGMTVATSVSEHC
jgi:hypothetical protein